VRSQKRGQRGPKGVGVVGKKIREKEGVTVAFLKTEQKLRASTHR